MKKRNILLMSCMYLSVIAQPDTVQSIVSAMHHIESTAHEVMHAVHQHNNQAVNTIIQQAKDALEHIIENVPHQHSIQDSSVVVTRNVMSYVQQAIQEVEQISIEALEHIEQNTDDIQATQNIIEDTYYALQQAVQFVAPHSMQQAVSIISQVSPTALVVIKDCIPSVKIDNRYSSKRNITGQKILSTQAPCMLSYKTVKCLTNVQKNLASQGFGLIIWQAYQSDEEQYRICNLVQNEQLVSWCPAVTQGRKLSVSMYKLDNGRSVTMPTDFQNMTIKARPDCTEISSKAIHNRDILTHAMKQQGFEQSSYYWWLFYLPKAQAQ